MTNKSLYRYELQHLSGGEWSGEWRRYGGSQSLEALRRQKRMVERQHAAAGERPGEHEYRIIEVKSDEVVPPAPTIEEKHAAELEALAASIKRWSSKAKRAATMLKKLRARKRRLDRLYAPRDEPA